MLLRKKDFIPSRAICVETKWWRVPLIDTPECNPVRRYMMEEVHKDPLSQKSISLLRASSNRNNIVKNKYGNPIYVATHSYTDRETHSQLEDIHNAVVAAIKDGSFSVEEEFLDISLKHFIEGLDLCQEPL